MRLAGALSLGLTLACGARELAEPDVRPALHVVRSVPALGERNVYPAPLGKGMGSEAKLTVWFSEAVQETTELPLEGESVSLQPVVHWDASHAELSAVIRPSLGRPSPLADDTEYAFDLSGLRGASGVPLDPDHGLLDGRLVFTTGEYDALLNHSCGHTLFGPYQSVVAGVEPKSAPDIGTTHIQYSVLLSGEGSEFSGWVRAHFASPGRYRLYFDALTRVELVRGADGDARVEVRLVPTPAACPGITHETTLEVASDETVFLLLGPDRGAERQVIVELVTE